MNLSDGEREQGPKSAIAETMDSQPCSPNNADTLRVPREIGPYKLLEKIGEGGMGDVYMAVQHKPIRRTVAIKVVKPGMDSRQVLARFEAERQALAIMDHPYIAKIHDAGQTESGRPYFVMELVKGNMPICFSRSHRLQQHVGGILCRSRAALSFPRWGKCVERRPPKLLRAVRPKRRNCCKAGRSENEPFSWFLTGIANSRNG